MMLQYDNLAFCFFALSIMIFYLIPSWYSIFARIIRAFTTNDESIGAIQRTEAEQKKVDSIKKELKGLSSLKKRSFIVQVCITVMLSVLFLWFLGNVVSNGEVQSFDPYSILEIDPSAEKRTIKKASRRLSKKYHPDMNLNNPITTAKYMMIRKATEILIDEDARMNWEMYGNPDGKRNLRVSIGLPSFLIDSANRNAVLLTYLLIMVGVIPYAVYAYYSNSSKYGEKDVMYDTYAWYHHTLSEHTLVKHLPEILSGGGEFRTNNNIPLDDNNEKQFIGNVLSKIRSQMMKPKINHPVCVKGNVLLHTHLLRKTDLLNDKLLQDLKSMLKICSTSLIDAMISVCKHQGSIQTAIQCIELGQYIVQAMWVRDSPLLQMPHFTKDDIKHATSGNGSDGNNPTLYQYRDLPMEQRKGMKYFSQKQEDDVNTFLNDIYPDITVESRVYVDDDEDDKVYEGDLCTIEVTITRNHLFEKTKEDRCETSSDGNDKAEQGNDKEKSITKKKKRVGLVHAPHFPFPVKECIWVILGQLKEGRILSIQKVNNPLPVVVHKIKFIAPPKGHHEFDLIVKSNAYIGTDQKYKLSVTTLDNSTLPAYKIHPDDKDLDDEPTLFEEILKARNEELDSGDEEEEDDDGDDDKQQKVEENGNNFNKQNQTPWLQQNQQKQHPQSAARKREALLRKASRQQAGDNC